MASKHKVRVVVRVRPALCPQDSTWVTVLGDTRLQTINHRNTDESLQYEFEKVFDPDASQQALYNGCARDLLSRTLQGQNASVFAYGPTGAGKTHTILGTAADPGLIPRCVRDMFEMIHEDRAREPETWLYDVKYSYLEIYQEKVQDLLDPSKSDLPIREDQHKNILVSGLSERAIDCVDDFNKSFAVASKNRTTAATRLNECSSRSHSLLVLRVTKTRQVPPCTRLCGKLAVIDLAGSEDNRRTGNQGVRLKESGCINSSLLALSQVVDALNKGQACVPYRSSKLTRLLQDCLGGNSHSCMIVNLAPEERFYFDTYTTLLFARKTKKIVNTVRTNEIKERAPLKRKHSESQSEADTSSRASSQSEADTSPEHVTTPEKKPRPEPFLSPLLRNQAQFQRDMKAEVLGRLAQLENKLLGQMSGQLPAEQILDTPSSSSLPDSTTGCDTPGMRLVGEKVQRLESLMSRLNSYRQGLSSFVDSAAFDSSAAHQGDYGVPDGALAQIPDTPLTPLLKKQTRRSKFQTCAATKIQHDSEKENLEQLQRSEAQLAHNARILSLLNSGSVRELQSLQTVGAKRAQLIHAYRELNGSFSQYDDLTSVPGLTHKYLTFFLKSNMVQR